MKEIEAIRTALAAVPTPGPWIGAGPSHGKPLPEYLNSVVYDGEDGDENDWGDICNDTTHEDAVFIAACNPAAMAAVLAHIEEQQREIDRLKADAERFTYLKQFAKVGSLYMNGNHSWTLRCPPRLPLFMRPTFDEALDDAIAEEQEKS